MKRLAILVASLCLVLFAGLPSWAGSNPQWKIIQVKRFTQSDGIGFSDEQLGVCADSLRKFLPKTKLAEQVVADGAEVATADAADTVIIESKIVGYQPPSGLFHPTPELTVEFTFYRASDRRLLKAWAADVPEAGKFGRVSLDYVAKNSGEFAIWEIKKAAKDLPPLSSFAPAAPAGTVAAAGSVPPSKPVSPPADVLTNNSVLEMVAAKLPDDWIITRIQTSQANFDLSTPALAELNQKGVSSAVVKAMLTAPKTAAPAASPQQKVAQVDGAWTDPATNLMWTLNNSGKGVKWNEADSYCRALRLGGFADWRLPTFGELEGVFDSSQSGKGAHVKGGIHVYGYGECWSGSRGPKLVEVFDFHRGKTESVPPDYPLPALCVRPSGP